MNQVVIETSKLQHNINIIKELIQKNEYVDDKKPIIIGILKGNGYGMGMLLLANKLLDNNIDFFAVSETQEAKKLRLNGFNNKILVLNSTGVESEIEDIVRFDLIATIGSKGAAIRLNEIANKFGKIVQAHIKIDTGFGRYGFVYSSELACEIVALFKDLNNIKVTGVYSHFSQSFEKSKNATKMQFDKFIKVTDELKNKKFDTGILHICNSPAFLKYKQMHLDAIRIGSAFTGRVQTQGIFGLQKVGYLESTISDIKILPKGHKVGYANTCELKRETKAAIVEAGYAEGIGVRGAKDTYRFIDRLRIIKDDIIKMFSRERIHVNINGKDCAVIGRVAMKNIIIDITDIDAKIGDKVKINVNLLFVDSSINRQEL